MVAATALAGGLPLYTRDPDDLRGLDSLVEIVTI
jgi:predicted nucleic acid-binding protein